jgi:hypothetical protein
MGGAGGTSAGDLLNGKSYSFSHAFGRSSAFLGSHIGLWDPFCPQSPSGFEFLCLKLLLFLRAHGSGVRLWLHYGWVEPQCVLGTLRSVRHLACSNSIRAWAPAKLKEMVLFGIVQVL